MHLSFRGSGWLSGIDCLEGPLLRIAPLIVAELAAPLRLLLAWSVLVSFLLPRPIQGAQVAPVSSGDARRNSRTLVQGEVVEGRLAGGQSHSYRIHLHSGQFLHIVADQRGIDIVLNLFGPDKAQLARMDRWSYRRGAESLSFVAAEPGNYRLEVQAHNKSDPPGSYQLTISEIRSPTLKDGVVVDAERAYNKGDELSSEGTPEGLHDAIAEFQEALRLWRSAGDTSFEATTLLYIGVDFYSSGDPQKALEFYIQALPLWPTIHDVSGEAVTLEYIGSVYESIGESEKALDYLRKALPLARASGEKRVEAQVLHDLGMTFLSLGQLDQALNYQTDAHRVSESAGDRVWSAHILHHIGEIYVAKGATMKALDYLNAALNDSHAVGDSLGEATALDHLGSAYFSLGTNAKALDCYFKALDLRRKAGYQLGEAQTFVNIGRVYDALNQQTKALEYFEQALQLSRAVSARPEESSALYGIAQAERGLGHLEEALGEIQLALGIIESQRRRVYSEELRASYFATLREPYDFYIDLLMQMHRQDPSGGYDAKALEASERARARTLLEILSESHAAVHQGIDSGLVEREQALQKLIDGKRDVQVSLLSGKHTEHQARVSEKELEELLTEFRELEGKIRASNPKYASLTQPRPLNMNEIQQRVMDMDTVLLEYALGEERSYVWVITSDSLASFVLPSKKDIEATSRSVYGFLSEQTHLPKGGAPKGKEMRLAQAQAAAKLSRMVLGPVVHLLETKRVVIVGDGALQYVPFGALPVPGPKHSGALDDVAAPANDLVPLIAEHEVVMLPSASVLAELRRETRDRKEAPKQVAVLADPVFELEDKRVKDVASQQARQGKIRKRTDGDVSFNRPGVQNHLMRSAADMGAAGGGMRFARLPFTRREADAVMAFTRAGEGLEALDFKASRTTAMSPELSEYRIVHFATHGILDSRHPELSGLVFSLVDGKGELPEWLCGLAGYLQPQPTRRSSSTQRLRNGTRKADQRGRPRWANARLHVRWSIASGRESVEGRRCGNCRVDGIVLSSDAKGRVAASRGVAPSSAGDVEAKTVEQPVLLGSFYYPRGMEINTQFPNQQDIWDGVGRIVRPPGPKLCARFSLPWRRFSDSTGRTPGFQFNSRGTRVRYKIDGIDCRPYQPILR